MYFSYNYSDFCFSCFFNYSSEFVYFSSSYTYKASYLYAHYLYRFLKASSFYANMLSIFFNLLLCSSMMLRSFIAWIRFSSYSYYKHFSFALRSSFYETKWLKDASVIWPYEAYIWLLMVYLPALLAFSC